MASPGFTHCAACGVKVRDAFFCRSCGQMLCSHECLQVHARQHVPQPDPAETPNHCHDDRPPD